MLPPPNFDCLSNAPLRERFPVSQRFIERGCRDFHDACRWLQTLPYGKNTRSADSVVLFEDGRGTCTTKHGMAAELAKELGLPVYKFIVFYRLDESIRSGANDILAYHNLEYIPATHCVLGESGKFIDLTWDNQTGKRKNLTDFELYLKTKPFLATEEEKTIRKWGYATYQKAEPQLARLDSSEIASIASAIVAHSQTCSC